MSVQDLKLNLKAVMDKRVANEGRAIRGTIQKGKFVHGSKQYPYIRAVDVNLSNGSRAWAMLSSNGKAVIVGA